ncbi:MAG: RepB family plasmid replication initiator protein [Neisseriaceae bacterium]|nr:MAG: RepB family plasmid replication initiator protein [Neisseriaceae bacterium]
MIKRPKTYIGVSMKKENKLEPYTYHSSQIENAVQSNSIVRSAQGLTIVEKRILLMAIAKTKGSITTLEIHAEDYAETFDLDVAVAYTELKKASLGFMKKQFTLTTNEEYKNKIREVKTTYNWLSYVKYIKDSGILEIKFNSDIYPMLFELTGNFTKYQLKQASALRSIYSVRLLEMFESVVQSNVIHKDKQGNTTSTTKRDSGCLKIHIDDFNHAMETPRSYHENFADLKKRIIEPAIKELIEKYGWEIKYRTIKKGRKVAMLEFKFYQDI